MQVERLETLRHDAFIERVLSVHLTSVLVSFPPEELLPFGPVEHGERRDPATERGILGSISFPSSNYTYRQNERPQHPQYAQSGASGASVGGL